MSHLYPSARLVEWTQACLYMLHLYATRVCIWSVPPEKKAKGRSETAHPLCTHVPDIRARIFRFACHERRDVGPESTARRDASVRRRISAGCTADAITSRARVHSPLLQQPSRRVSPFFRIRTCDRRVEK